MRDYWKTVSVYMILLVLMLLGGMAFGQVQIIHFNADWNSANNVEWFGKLSDCDKKYIDIGKDSEAQTKYNIAVVPTIIIFNDGEEIKRFKADISFTMKATRKEVQGIIDEQLMSDF